MQAGVYFLRPVNHDGYIRAKLCIFVRKQHLLKEIYLLQLALWDKNTGKKSVNKIISKI